MKDFFGEDLCAAAAQAYMESLLSGESGRRQAKQQRLPTKQLGGLELELNQAAHAQLWLSSMQRLPRARTRKQARRLRTLISRRTLPTMERGRRL